MFALGGQFENGETTADNSTAEPAFWAPRIEIKSEKWQSSKKKNTQTCTVFPILQDIKP